MKTGLANLHKRISKGKENSTLPQGALVALDVRTGGILSMVGGRDFSESPFNRAVDALRQPGSAFKPIVYALAIARGFTQASLVLDAPVVFKGGSDNTDWRPENYSGHYLGEMTLRRALALSKNIPAVRLAERLGPSDLVQFAHKMGIQSPLPPDLSIALGTAGINLLELTAAMSVFPQRGNHIAPFGVAEILDRNSEVLWRAKPAVRPVLNAAHAGIMVDMLQGVVQEGTGKRARQLNMPVGGKTGTTNDFKDALFVGFSPAAACGVWVGMDDASPLGDKETGARAALPIWIDFMAATRPESTPLYFDIPDGTRKIFMDPVTGRQVSENEKNAVRALFARGTEPSKR